VAVEFDMPVADLLDLDRRDGRAIDEESGRDQHLAAEINTDRMAARNVKIL
jgi:hypothetical protein